MLRIAAIMILTIPFVYSCERPSRLVYINLHTRDCPQVYTATLIKVTSEPTRYAGYCVGVAGYYRSGRLYLSEEDSKHLWGVTELAVSEEPELSGPKCNSIRLFLAGPLKMLDGYPILLPQYATQPGAEGTTCIEKEDYATAT